MEKAVPASDPAAAPATPGAQRPRRAKPAPAVLFQPPEPDRPLPRQPAPAASRNDEEAEASGGTTGVDEPGPAAGADQPSRSGSSGEVDQPTDAAATDPGSTAAPADERAPEGGPQQPAGTPTRTPKARATPARKAAPRKAAGTSTGKGTATTSPGADVTPATPAAGPTRRAARSTEAAATPTKRTTTPTKRAAGPRKNAAPKQAAPAPRQPAEQTPAEQPPSAVVAGETTPTAQETTPESELRAVTAHLLDHPGFAPELLALAAVRALGPGAADWAGRLRARYPDAQADGLARLATRRFVRAAGAGGAAAALAGLFAPLAELASVLWTHSNLVLHLAAAYGRDPAHPDRAVELLVLTQVHPDAESARAALAAVGTADDPVEGTWPRAAEAAWRLAAPLTAQAGGWLALRLASRLLPGAAVLAAALGDSAAADRLAARAVAAYRPSPADAAGRPVRAS
ncbi:hypothetical protein [Micromonospora sp. NPDC005206]|uniref:hypothetical protein n=1 Tax=Micromonospora sp. NPDC005206 TaxID=3157022 RepID=UPI0033A6445F